MGVSPETLRRTNLGCLQTGSRINLERAVSVATRMGGHFVQGHVDTIAKIVSVVPDGNALTFRFQPREREILKYIVEKGYVTIDGTSLTVTKVAENGDDHGWWEIMLIAYTQVKVALAKKGKDDLVNVEVDMVGKYIEKVVRDYFQGSDKGEAVVLERIVSQLVDEKLKTIRT